MRRGLELQFRTRSRITKTEAGRALGIQFKIGPLAIFIIANLPEYDGGQDEQPLAYVKVSLSPDEDWQIFKDHGANGAMPRHKTDKETR